MALIENTLFGTRDKVAEAIQRLKSFEPEEGYYVAFSGGKDSQCVYHLCEMAGVKFDAKNTRKIVLKLNTGTDADILKRLDTVGNRQGYIKRLIREDIAKVDTL